MSVTVPIAIPAVAATEYPIVIGARLENTILKWLSQYPATQVVIITDSTVKKLFASKMAEKLLKRKIRVLFFAFPAGEKSKNAETKARLEAFMLRNRCDRKTLCVALGGGVVGDMVGFLAATYMRGVAFVQIPTTLLAMVDSSVGGKTGIDTAYGKNLIGAFYQPKAVFSNLEYLRALPQKHLICGVVESLKMFLTHDGASFEYAQKNMAKILAKDLKVLQEIVRRAVQIKAGVVMRDEKESGERSLMNFGHTIAHALEQLSNYKMLHGYAVGLGIMVEAKISELLGVLAPEDCKIILDCYTQLGIRIKDIKKFSATAIVEASKIDKKAQNGVVNYVLLRKIGEAYVEKKRYVHSVEKKVVDSALKLLVSKG